MPKTRKNHKKHTKKFRNISRKMRGGELSQEDEDHLRGLQFNDDEIAHFNELNIPFNIINQAIQYYHDNSHQLISGIAEQMSINAANAANQNVVQDENQDENQGEDQNDNSGMDSLHDSDLADDGNGNANGVIDNIPAIPQADDDIHNLDDLDESGNTTLGDESFGGKRRSKKRRPLQKRRTHKMRGGRCYGNGVGANSYDPNYSIYNTNMMKLFPYKA